MPDLADSQFWLGVIVGVLLTLAAIGLDQVASLVFRYARTLRRRRAHDRPE